MHHGGSFDTLEKRSGLPSLRLVESSYGMRRLAYFMVFLLAMTVSALVFLPWQQSVKGTGRVVGYAPLDRQQTIEAPIYGRIVEWWVSEGSLVKAGDRLLEIRDNDPTYLENLKKQLAATQIKYQAGQDKVHAYTERVKTFNEARAFVLSAADTYVEIAKQKVQAEEQGLQAAQAALFVSQQDFDRTKRLSDQGIDSIEKFQKAEQKFKEDSAKVKEARIKVDAALNAVKAAKADREAKDREATGKIQSAQADLEEARGSGALADKERNELQVKINQQLSQVVVAPRDGTVLRLIVNQGAELVKPGDPLLVLVPDTQDRAVELLMDGNDIPLVVQDAPVRLQFEGWPAVQFTGWPSIAIGTFGGNVRLIDATDNGKGKFRILVLPDSTQGEHTWPPGRFLRQGVRANGWVLLRQVPLYWEIWRQLNGFPPVLTKEPDEGLKPPKIKTAK